MDFSKDSLAFWATIAGTVLAFLGLIQSHAWLAGIGAILLVGSAMAILYARMQRRRLLFAALKVEGRSIDSLNMANLNRRLNRTLLIQEADHIAEIDGNDLTITWQYSGYCRAEREAVFEFSMDADNNTPFDELELFAFDLGHDQRRGHKIHPILVGPDGISKKVAVPFEEPLSNHEPFCISLTCVLPGCIKSGVEYYTSTLSFDQSEIRRHTVSLKFLGSRPEWLRVYDCGQSSVPTLLKELRSTRESAAFTEYLDLTENMPAQSARIYVFRRTEQMRRAA